MNFKDYQKEVRQMPLYDDPVLGLAGEVGEVLEIIKKDRRGGERHRPADPVRLGEELGDVLWYLTVTADRYGLDLNTIAEENVSKLTKRHKI